MTLEEKWNLLLEIVNRQADDPSIWFVAETITESFLQQALRELHMAIDGMTQEEGAKRALRSLRDD